MMQVQSPYSVTKIEMAGMAELVMGESQSASQFHVNRNG